MSDRSTENGKGIQCYDADTLDLIWYKKSISCSSHLPVIIDVNKDGILDIIVSQQRNSNAGIYCLDGRNGNYITGKYQDSISGLATHEPFAVHDIDNDDNLELATCVYSNVKIFDLGTWKIEATLASDGKPPYYANVIGDNSLEIILSEETNSVKIYNNQYQLIHTITGVSTYSSTVQDIDGDGLNELITAGTDGIIRVYDTLAEASNPLPRTNTNHYSERNTRTAIYIPPPGGTSAPSNNPTITNPNPTNQATNIPITTNALTITIQDPNGDPLDYTITTTPNIGTKTEINTNNGTKTCTITELTYSTTYTWNVKATDGKSWTEKTYTFTTQNAPANSPIITNPNPTNQAINIPITTNELTIKIQDPNGDSFDYIITTSPDIGSKSMSRAQNGTKTCTISDLDYDTTYTWYVKCKDLSNGKWTNKTFWFKTEAKQTSSSGSSSSQKSGGSSTSNNDDIEINNIPAQPTKPSGLNSIEKGVVCNFSSYATDTDGDKIKLMFDWGDGNYSNWSSLEQPNTTINMSHSWDKVSNYSIKVIAQDEKGANSSWSEPQIVTIFETEDEPLYMEIIVLDKTELNETVFFDASGCYDPDGTIVSYQWDFGDGVIINETNKTVTHIYENPGDYTVTLLVIDDKGNTYNTSINVKASDVSLQKEENESFPIFNITVVCVFIIIISLMIVFRDDVTVFLLDTYLHLFKNEASEVKNRRFNPMGATSFSENNIESSKDNLMKLGNYHLKKEIQLYNPKEKSVKDKRTKTNHLHHIKNNLYYLEIEKKVDALIHSKSIQKINDN